MKIVTCLFCDLEGEHLCSVRDTKTRGQVLQSDKTKRICRQVTGYLLIRGLGSCSFGDRP